MAACTTNDETHVRHTTSGHSATASTIPGRLRANADLPDLEDFLQLYHADRDDQRISYREVLAAATRFAGFYRQCGLGAGDRVVIILEHSLDLYAAFLGALLGGFVPSLWSFPSPKVSQREYFKTLSALLASAAPRLLLTYPGLRDCIRAEADLHDVDTQVRVSDEVPAEGGASPLARPTDPDQVAFLQYSSGTTGLKKGVAISQRALLWQVDRYAEAIRLSEDDRIVSWLPLYHDMGLIACLLLPFLRRTRLVAMCPFQWVQRPAMWLEAVTASRATLSWLPNFAYSFLARSVTDAELDGIDLSSLRGVVNCSEPVLADSHARFLKRFEPVGLRPSALCASYAMAENTFAVTSGGFDAALASDCIDARLLARDGRAEPVEPTHPHARTLVSSGAPLPETSVRIVDKDDQTLPDRSLGEIVLRSPCLLSEYDRNPEATQAAIRGDEYYTGDLGYLADGELFVTGRAKDLLIIRGQNLYPQDVEAIVNDVPGVIPGRTVAVGVPNAQIGTEDLIVLAETNETDPRRRDSLRGEITQRVAAAVEVAPADVRLCEHMWLRKSTSGKISRSINRERYLQELAAQPLGDAPAAITNVGPNEASSIDRVRRCVARVMAQAPRRRTTSVGDDDPLMTSGAIDSLGLVDVIHAIEADCEVSISARALATTAQTLTVRSLADLVDRVRDGEMPDEMSDTFPRCRDDVPMIVGEPRTPRRSSGFWTWYYRWVFWRRGVRVGRGLRVLGPLILRFDGDPRNITIGDNVTLMPWVDLKIREYGRIILHDGVQLDTTVRLVAANDARIELGEDVRIAIGTVINAGEDVIIGRRTAIAGYCTIIASEHRYESKTPFMQQGYHHEPVYIGEDVWVAANVFIGRGSRIGNGAVLGVKSDVRGDFPAYGVVMGNPARVVRFRS